MSRDRDWVDYANLASNIAQNVQLRDMQHKLGAVASAIQSEQATAEREHSLREAVFQAESMLQNLRATSKDNPRGSLAWARHNLLQFKRNEVTSASFRSYEDKERLRAVVDGHEQLIQECATGLWAQQRDEAERCGQYLLERGTLDLLIALRERQQTLDSARSALGDLVSNANRGWPKSAMRAGFVICLVGMVIAYYGVKEMDVGSVDKGAGRMWLGIACAIVGGVLHVWGATSERVETAEIQKMKVKELESESHADAILLARLEKTISSSPLAELLTMRKEREALIALVLGNTARQAKSDPNQASFDLTD